MKHIVIILILLLSNISYALQKNVASQKWVVFAFDTTDNTAKTGDAANITANLRIDGAAANDVDDTNPAELEDGYYIFDLSQAETNGDYILICPASATANIQVIGCPMAVWTTPPYFSTFSIDSNGRIDVIKVAGTTQTANDNGADINAILSDTGTDGVVVASLNADAIEAGDFKTGAIDADALAADYLAAIEAEAVDALEGFDLDHLIAVACDTGPAITDHVVDNSILAFILDDAGDISEYDDAKHSLYAIGTDTDDILTDTAAYDTDAEYAAAIWNAATNDYGGVGTHAQALQDILEDTQTTLNNYVDDLETRLSAVRAGYLDELAAANIPGDIDAILLDTGTTLDTLIKDIPTVAEFEARSLVAADYTVVGDLGTVQTGDSYAIVNGDHGLVSIQDDIDAILLDTGTDGVVLAADSVDATSVHSDALDAILMSDLGAGAPSMTASIKTAINWLYSAWRNKTITNGTNSEIEFYNDADVKIAEADISDDGTDFTRGEVRAAD